MRTSIARARGAFDFVRGKHLASHEACISNISTLFGECGRGIALGEVHGDYAFARFAKSLIPVLAARGARRLYVEMFRHSCQPILDRWQDAGDDKALLDYINEITKAYSEHMWPHYWGVLTEARKHGIRVVAIEPDQVYAPYPGLEMVARNIAWEKTIEADQGASPVPFFLYCGRDHLLRRGSNNTTPISSVLGVPAVVMRRGRMGFAKAVAEARTHNLWVPKAPDQTPIYGAKIAIAAKIV